MNYKSIANSIIADYEIGKICVDYVNHCIIIELKSPKNELDVLQFSDFEEITVTRTEPWGPGMYVAGSALQYREDKMIAEIELNSGDQIKITTRAKL